MNTRSANCVLLCEDEHLIAIYLEELLKERGVDVLGPYATLEESIAAVDRLSPTGAILDIALADGPCVALARRLAEFKVPILVYCSLPPSYYPEAALLADVWLVKPVVGEDVVEALMQLVATKLEAGRQGA